jgi:hypothetical protein
VTYDQRTPLQLRRALLDAKNALADERAKVVRLQAQIKRLERVTAGDGARIVRLQAIEKAAEQWIIALECMPEYAGGAEQHLIELVKDGAS